MNNIQKCIADNNNNKKIYCCVPILGLVNEDFWVLKKDKKAKSPVLRWLYVIITLPWFPLV